MFAEVNQAVDFFRKKFGNGKIPAGTYPIPTQTSKGKAYMAVKIDEEGHLWGFDLFWDKKLTKSWYEPKNKN